MIVHPRKKSVRQFKNLKHQSKITSRLTEADLDVIRQYAAVGLTFLCKRLPHVTENQIRYGLERLGLTWQSRNWRPKTKAPP